jgi:arginyl-tRNA synthetase
LGTIEHVEKIEIAGPGFINFHLSREYFSKVVSEVDEKWGKNNYFNGENIGIEYYQPNYFKALHVGHLMNGMIGESLARLADFSGATVSRIAYYADIGPHIAKAIWGIRDLGMEPHTPADLSRAYEHGTAAYKENVEAKEAIDVINSAVYAEDDPEIHALYKKGCAISAAQAEALLERLKISFDKTFYESEGGPIGKKLVEKHMGGVFEEGEGGAIIFPGEKHGLHTRVFLTSKGLPVYETKDLGLAQLKLDAFGANQLVYVVDVEQSEYFKVVLKVITMVFPELAGKVHHVAHGRLRLPSGRMSSRGGNVILANDILDELHEAVKERNEDEEIAEQVAQAAMRYLILRVASGSNIVFEKEQALSFEGSSGPYLQYSYARAKSVLAKAESREEIAGNVQTLELALELIPELERLLPRFPQVVERAAREYEPHYVTTYLTELASAFNSWYAQEKIIGSPDEVYKLALTRAFAQTMKNGLWLLGIEAPEKM